MLSNYRPFAILATVATIIAAVAFLFGSGSSTPRGAQAASPPAKGVTCADVYQDIDNDTPLGSPHDGDDQAAASSMTRLEPSQEFPGNWDSTTVTYIGPDLVSGDTNVDPYRGPIPGDAIPDVQSTLLTCAATTASANGGAEAGAMHPRNVFVNQYDERPRAAAFISAANASRFGTYDGTNAEDGGAASTCSDGVDNGDSGSLAYTWPTATTVSQDQLDTDCYDFPGSSPDTMVTSGCAFAEAATGWSRLDTFTITTTKTKKAVNYGRSILMYGTSAPAPANTWDTNGDGKGDTAKNPNDCAQLLAGPIVLTLAFPSVTEATVRTAQTDDALAGKNTGLTNDADGAGVRDTADGTADDWDGDGCTDWDELDKNFSGTYPVSVTGPVHGMDPFNPWDCDQNVDSTIAISVVALHNEPSCTALPGMTSPCVFAKQGNGNYFRCLGDMTDPKGGGTRAVDLRMSCYSDSPFSIVNSSYSDAAGKTACNQNSPGNAPPRMCGDGQSGGTPPGSPVPAAGQVIQNLPYQDIDAVNYPILAPGSFNKGANTLTISGCFADYAAPPIGPHIYGSGSFDTRTGAGTFVVRFGIANIADCDAAHGINACLLMPGGVCTATMVELQSKKTLAGAALPVTQHRDSDNDGCTDTQELRSSKSAGGKRDPFNQWDFLDSDGSGQVTVGDILAAVTQYFKDDNIAPNTLDSSPGFPPFQPGYNQATDRSAIPGANDWNSGPPNGQQRVDDILQAVKQYFDNCNT